MKKGFTLVELLVVIAILVLLAGITIPAIGRMVEKGEEKPTLDNQFEREATEFNDSEAVEELNFFIEKFEGWEVGMVVEPNYPKQQGYLLLLHPEELKVVKYRPKHYLTLVMFKEGDIIDYYKE